MHTGTLNYKWKKNSKSQCPSLHQVCRISLTSITTTYLWIEATWMDFPPDPTWTILDSDKEGYTPESKLRTAFKKTVHQHKWMVSNLNFSDKLDILHSDFTSEESRSGSNRFYRAEVGMISAACIIKYNCETQYIQGWEMLPGKPEDHNYYRGELGGQLRVMWTIEIMESILGSTALVVNICDNIRALRRATTR